MRIDLSDQTIELAADRSIVLHGARNAQIVCIRGRIWITEDPLRNDVVLGTGQSHLVRGTGKTLVTSFVDSRVRLQEPPRSARSAGSALALAFTAQALIPSIGAGGALVAAGLLALISALPDFARRVGVGRSSA